MSDFLGGFAWASEDSFDSVLKKRKKVDLKKVSSLDDLAWASEDSFDSVLKKRKKVDLKKVSSLDDLAGFVRVSQDTLISKSDKDLWKVEEDDDGNLLVYRLFDSDKSPLGL